MTRPGHESVEELYLDLLKRCLTRYGFGNNYSVYQPIKGTLRGILYRPLKKFLLSRQLEIVRQLPLDLEKGAEGRIGPADGETMIGLRRLDNLQQCIADVLQHSIPGDLIETGVWRGGATIFMRAVLRAYNDTQRVVWVADSFQGLPKPNPLDYRWDAGDWLWRDPQLAVSLEEVKANFTKYGLLDDQVRFLVGWFGDTLPYAPIERLAILRLDGDMYESTMDSLHSLYPKLSQGGYVIVDDYGAVPACKAAVEDFRATNGIMEKLEQIDWTGVFWKRLS